MLSDDNEHLDIFRYAAGGFQDFTRIAASDPTMWRDISLANQQSIVTGIDRYVERLERMREAIAWGLDWIMGASRGHVARVDYFHHWLTEECDPVTDSHPSVFEITGAKKGITGKIRVPGDKSISHRSIMLGALADGVTTVEGFLEGEDAIATVKAFRDMGVQIDGPNGGHVTVHGVGRDGLGPPIAPLTWATRGHRCAYMCGILAGQSFDSELTGDSSFPAARCVVSVNVGTIRCDG